MAVVANGLRPSHIVSTIVTDLRLDLSRSATLSDPVRRRLIKAMLTIIVSCFAILVFVSTAYLRAQERIFPDATFLEGFANHAVAHSDPSKPFTFDTSPYATSTRDLPIGVFDSGIGGLTVLEAIYALDSFNNETLVPKPDGKLDFENESFIYLGDQANMPYGNYPSAKKTDYLRELILKDAVFLLGKRYRTNAPDQELRFDKPPVKAIVIACNTATAYGLQDIRQLLSRWNLKIPVIGVVEAGARGVAESIDENSKAGSVAILATVGTCQSQAYPQAIRAAMGLAGKTPPAIIQQGSIDLATAIETKPESIPRAIAADIDALLNSHQAAGRIEPIQTIVLGCTHFPLVEADIRKALESLRRDTQAERTSPAAIADEITFIDPAKLTARELFVSLALNRLRRSEPNSAERDRFFISIPNAQAEGLKLTSDGSIEHQHKTSRAVGRLDLEDTYIVPMTTSLIPPSSQQLLRQHLPNVWQAIN